MQINHYRDFMDYWEHLAAVSEVCAPPEYATVVVVENLGDNNYGQIFVLSVEYLKQISEQLQTLEA